MSVDISPLQSASLLVNNQSIGIMGKKKGKIARGKKGRKPKGEDVQQLE